MERRYYFKQQIMKGHLIREAPGQLLWRWETKTLLVFLTDSLCSFHQYNVLEKKNTFKAILYEDMSWNLTKFLSGMMTKQHPLYKWSLQWKLSFEFIDISSIYFNRIELSTALMWSRWTYQKFLRQCVSCSRCWLNDFYSWFKFSHLWHRTTVGDWAYTILVSKDRNVKGICVGSRGRDVLGHGFHKRLVNEWCGCPSLYVPHGIWLIS